MKSCDANVKILGTQDLAFFFKKCQDDAFIHDLDITRDNKYFVVYKKTNGMFPAQEDINFNT